MVDITELNLNEEELGGAIDYSAPEGGTFVPEVGPGYCELIFKLESGEAPFPEPFETKETQDGGRRYLQVNFAPIPVVNGEEKQALHFQRVNTIKTEKMAQSTVASLLRALGVRIDGPLTAEVIVSALEEADRENRRFTAFVDWRVYNKGTEQTASTNPNTKRGELPWPKDGDGNPKPTVVFSDGNELTGRAEVNPFRFKYPRD